MRKNDYLSSPTVKEFIAWMETILDTPQGFVHKYFHVKEDQTYEFDNLYDACGKYHWPPHCPDEFSKLSESLRKSIRKSDERLCLTTCEKILEWGKTNARHNYEHLYNCKPTLCSHLCMVRKRLESEDKTLSEYYLPEIRMTSGFSKIYAAMMDNYMIY